MCLSLTLKHLSGKQFGEFNCRSYVIRKQMSHRGSWEVRGGILIYCAFHVNNYIYYKWPSNECKVETIRCKSKRCLSHRVQLHRHRSSRAEHPDKPPPALAGRDSSRRRQHTPQSTHPPTHAPFSPAPPPFTLRGESGL